MVSGLPVEKAPTRFMARIGGCLVVPISLLLLQSCEGPQSDTGTYAYVAPATLNLRHDLTQKNTIVSVLNHADRVEILEVRRRFIHIKTRKGVEGWVDASQLLTPEQMANLQQQAKEAAALPSEGAATVFDPLNVHLEPSRQSPSFARIPENGSVEVLAERATPRLTGPAPVPVFKLERAQPHHRKKKETKDAFRLPAKPAPPKAPSDWLALSGIDATAPQKADTSKKPQEPARPVVLETWTLVRLKDHRAGWVLSRNLMMSIPDEVAQYAEGKRITSYFDLGAVTDEEKGLKHNWLWTTLSSTANFDFDSWRVFTWNRRRHRYETSYRQRDVEGYFPVHVEPAPEGQLQRQFQLITKDDDGKFRRRTYNFDGTLVRLANTEFYTPGQSNAPNASGPQQAKPQQGPGWWQRHWAALKARLKLTG